MYLSMANDGCSSEAKDSRVLKGISLLQFIGKLRIYRNIRFTSVLETI